MHRKESRRRPAAQGSCRARGPGAGGPMLELFGPIITWGEWAARRLGLSSAATPDAGHRNRRDDVDR